MRSSNQSERGGVLLLYDNLINYRVLGGNYSYVYGDSNDTGNKLVWR